MTNITPATHKGLSELILNNIETYQQTKEAEDVLIVFRTNLETLKQIYNEYTKKVKEVRELVELYNQVQNCTKKNLRKARNRKKTSAPLVKTKILFSINKNVGNTLELSEINVSNKKSTLGKFSYATAISQ
ncbi:hypothetical protein F0919_08000 [Taibaiella lutea]|uniref:Uncharacterized protein n=1 Tax=Taibaiella lutea TaxID=2608001 RepID=A0A5M6CHB5_9BACT|nr:hypothetical protein [Taibaiella lutea]KAA5534554.1 hypothetical protein F0919_08000 [Taibaiella lutea]